MNRLITASQMWEDCLDAARRAEREAGLKPGELLEALRKAAGGALMPPSKYRDLIIESCAQRIETHDVYTNAATYFANFLRSTKGGQ